MHSKCTSHLPVLQCLNFEIKLLVHFAEEIFFTSFTQTKQKWTRLLGHSKHLFSCYLEQELIKSFQRKITITFNQRQEGKKDEGVGINGDNGGDQDCGSGPGYFDRIRIQFYKLGRGCGIFEARIRFLI